MHKPYHFLYGASVVGLVEALWANSPPATYCLAIAVVVFGAIAYSAEKN